MSKKRGELHYVNTFISFDAPQQGAHLNTSLQAFIRDHGNSEQQAILQSIAAKQMLYNNVYGQLHDQFYNNQLRALHNNDPQYGYTNGYPRRCLNYAVSNGNHDADYPNLSTSDVLATLRIYVNVNANDLYTFPATQITENIFVQERDLWPGSTFTHDLTTLFLYGTQFIKREYWGPLWFDAYGTWRFQVNFNPSYTPTESSIDLDGYSRTTNGTLIGGTSWFNGTLEQITFRRHEELTNESRTQVMNWLNQNRTNPYLGRPSNPTTDIVVGDRVILRFVDEASFEQGFKVERKIEGGTWQEVATLQPNSNRFDDFVQNLQPMSRYYYRVRSYNGTSFSPYSEEASIFILKKLQSSLKCIFSPPPPPPQAPTASEKWLRWAACLMLSMSPAARFGI